MSYCHYITTFRNLVVSEDLDGRVELLPGVYVANGFETRKKYLTDELVAAAGVIEAEFLANADHLVFGEFSEEDLGEAQASQFLRAIIIWIEGLFKNAWLLEDHTLECDAIFIRAGSEDQPEWSSNFLAARPISAEGELSKSITMDKARLKEWSEKNHQVESYLHEADSGATNFMMEEDYARTGRAMKFVTAARKASNMAFKITHYCSALETLFTTSSSSLTHKLSERTAFFLGTRGYNKLEVFRRVKKAYAVRSRLVHGDTLRGKQIDRLYPISMRCDEYLRTILNSIFDSPELREVFDSHEQAIEKYFAEMIFGEPA